jgi:ribosomal protein S18 acetylase RimI-like enzyme
MGDCDLVTAMDVQLMQGLAQRVTAARPDLVNSDTTFGELAWIWGKGHASDGGTWPRRLWFSGDALVAWGWAYLPHQVRRSDGSVQDVTGAYLGYQVHPGHAALVDDVIGWYDANKTAEFEPVGTHPGYRRLGLGTAMLLHGMHLVREAGATHMTVA